MSYYLSAGREEGGGRGGNEINSNPKEGWRKLGRERRERKMDEEERETGGKLGMRSERKDVKEREQGEGIDL